MKDIEVKCKFCGGLLEVSTMHINILSKEVRHMECLKCISSIRSPWRGGKQSKHQITYTFSDKVIHSEVILTDNNIHIETLILKNKTYISKIHHGGPLEYELENIVTLPATDVKPGEPDFEQKLKVWLTFS